MAALSVGAGRGVEPGRGGVNSTEGPRRAIAQDVSGWILPRGGSRDGPRGGDLPRQGRPDDPEDAGGRLGRAGQAERGEHLQREERRLDQPLAVQARGVAAPEGQRDGDRRDRRRPGVHPHEPPRRREGPGDRDPPLRRDEPPRPGDPVRPRDGPGGPQGRVAQGPRRRGDRDFGRPHARRDGHHHRQRLRLREHDLQGDHLRPEAERDPLGRPGLPEPDPDRRLHQPGQLRRAAHQRGRRAGRDQRRDPVRGAGDRVRPADRRREAGGDRDDEHPPARPEVGTAWSPARPGTATIIG